MKTKLKTPTPRKLRVPKCPRCKGKGWVMLAHGPMVMDGQGVPAGVSKYDCGQCDGSGHIRRQPTRRRKGT